jgi:two-component system sensor histidine kinase BaeS
VAGVPDQEDAQLTRGDGASEGVAGRQRTRGKGGRKGKRKRRHLTFRVRISLSFLAVTVVTALAFVIVQMVVWSGQFSTYTRENMENIADSASKALSHEYELRGYWTSSGLSSVLAVDEIFDGLGIQVLNSGGMIIYDNTWIGDSSISLAPDASSMISAPIVTDEGRQVGTVNVWAMGSDVLLTPRDINFRDSSNQGMVVSAGIGVVLAVIMALLLSRWLTGPVKRITTAAERIKEGDLGARTGVRGKDEIGQLGETFDEMAEKFEKDRELERRLTADVAHELRTPLMAIMATVEAMQDGVMPCDSDHLALVDEEVRRLSRLVDSMLRLSRLESHSVKMDFFPIDTVDFVRGMVTSRQALMADAGLALTFENRTGQDEFEAEFDRDNITQALTNILQNASRYTPAPGSVTVWVDGDDDEVRIGVSDTGIGIAPENIDRIFYRFWRAEGSRNRAKGGLGVGMAVTKEIVDAHHGRIDVESELGKGTTFTIVLPRRQQDDAADDDE